MVEAITIDLNEEQLQKLVADKQKYINYKNNIQKIEKKIKQENDNLKKDDSNGNYRASRSRSRQGKHYDREKKVFEIDRLETEFREYKYQMKLLKEKYPNTNLSN